MLLHVIAQDSSPCVKVVSFFEYHHPLIASANIAFKQQRIKARREASRPSRGAEAEAPLEAARRRRAADSAQGQGRQSSICFDVV